MVQFLPGARCYQESSSISTGSLASPNSPNSPNCVFGWCFGAGRTTPGSDTISRQTSRAQLCSAFPSTGCVLIFLEEAARRFCMKRCKIRSACTSVARVARLRWRWWMLRAPCDDKGQGWRSVFPWKKEAFFAILLLQPPKINQFVALWHH